MAIKKSNSVNYRNLMTFEAGEDLSKKKYRFVKLNSDGEVVVCAANETTIGILIIQGKESEQVSVLTQPGTRAILEMGTTSAAIPAGTRLTVAADGKAIPQGSGKTANTLHHGIVVNDGLSGTSAKAGNYVTVLFTPNTGPAA